MASMKRTIASLLLATALTGVWGAAHVQAEPVSTFLIGVGAGFSATVGGTAIAGTYLGALGAGVAAGQFLAANIATIVLAGVTLAASLLQNNQLESSQVNFRQAAPIRRHAAGLEEVGGHIHFAEWGPDGELWYVVAHCDSELMELLQIKLDNIEIELDSENRVTTEDFQAEESGFLGFTSKKPFYKVWVSTFGVLDPVPPKPPAFLAAFPEWTIDHRQAGTTLTFIRVDPVKDEDVSKVYRWRGALGLGEPSVSLVGIWNRIYDPRDHDQEMDNRSTWKASTNVALIAAWHRYRRHGYGERMSDIAWDKVAAEADICDQPVTDRYGVTAPRYACGGVWGEDRENVAVEADILMSCDGQSLVTSEGKWWPRVGRWSEPALKLTAQRDIMAMSDSEPADGEAELDGVIVEYKDQSLGFAMQPCAAWINPDFYDAGRAARFKTLKIPTCKNHNQAVRLAKAFGRRLQPKVRISPTTGIRGMRARRERIIEIDFDETINGAWQIASPVEIDAAGRGAVMGLVPASPTDWDLLPGEEGEKPVGESIERDNTIPNPEGVTVSAIPIAGSNGNAVRLQAVFDEPARVGDVVEFQYRPVGGGDGEWLAMATVMDQLLANSDVVEAGRSYEVRARMRRGTRSTDWVTPYLTVSAVADPVAPGALTSVMASGGLGRGSVGFTTPNSANLRFVALYRVPAGQPLDRADDLVISYAVAPGEAYSKTDGDAGIVSRISGVASLGTGWAGTAASLVGVPGGNTTANFTTGAFGNGDVVRIGFNVASVSAGDVRSRFETATDDGPDHGVVGQVLERRALTAARADFRMRKDSLFNGTVTNIAVFVETLSCAPQGKWDYYLEPMNGSLIAGPLSGPHPVTII